MNSIKITIFSLCLMNPWVSHAASAPSWIKQGWTAKERAYWHYKSAGQALAPESWLISLERSNSRSMLMDRKYLRSLGFIFGPRTKYNQKGLPVGFSVAPKESPVAGYVGFTCSACHTGEITYRNKTLYIDGASSLVDDTSFIQEYYSALGETYEDPKKWSRFFRRVSVHEDIAETQLKDQVKESLGNIKWSATAASNAPGIPVEGGPGRMDPFNTIGNGLFGFRLLAPENYAAIDAPVNPPYLWDVWRFNWVHYNSSFTEPMARNVLQILGNGGVTNFLDPNGNPAPAPDKWNSSIDFIAAQELEVGIRNLSAPKWPTNLFGRYNKKSAIAGKRLFEENCSDCHSPRPIVTEERHMAQLAVSTIPQDLMGTDPNELQAMKRLFNAEKLTGISGPRTTAPDGLKFVIESIKTRGYDLLGYNQQQRAEADGFGRPDWIRAANGYKARTLDGIWATPPFLHNGSIPNMYELLSPQSERSSTFYVGTKVYDPKKMGYVKTNSGFLLDTRLPGNSNQGHEFSNDKRPGVIGRALTHAERYDLIEYLKALPDMPPSELEPVHFDWEWTPHANNP